MVNEIEKRRVVVTGIGLVSPLGNTAEETWSALLAGRGGVDYITRFDTSNFPVRFAAETKGFDPTKFVEKKELKKMEYFIYFAIASSREAIADSGLKIEGDEATEIGVYIGSGIGGFGVFEREHTKMMEGGPAPSPFFIPAAIINLASGYVSSAGPGPEFGYCHGLQLGGSCHWGQLQNHPARRCRSHDLWRKRRCHYSNVGRRLCIHAGPLNAK